MQNAANLPANARAIDRWIAASERWIMRGAITVLWVSTVIIFLILAANTILRYAVGKSLQAANEVPELLFPWLVMSGVVIAALHGSHITTTFLMDRFAPATRRTMAIIVNLAVALVYFTLTFATARMLDIVHDERTPILSVPGSVTYGCVMLGLAVLGYIALTNARRAWRNPPDAELHSATTAPSANY